MHSYGAAPNDPSVISSFYKYGENEIITSVSKNNVYGCQFHPEKSGDIGLNKIETLLTYKIL